MAKRPTQVVNSVWVGDKSFKSYVKAVELMLKVYDRVFIYAVDNYIPKAIEVAKKAGRILGYTIKEGEGTTYSKWIAIIVGRKQGRS